MSWLRRVLTRKRMESDLDRELRFHFETHVADKVRAGMEESEARRVTRLEFGGLEQIKEDCRESRGTQWLESMAQDLRFALRQLLKSPGFAVIAVLTLSIGLGASAAIFNVIDSVLLAPLPYAHLDRLVYPVMLSRTGDTERSSYLSYLDERAMLRTFDGLAGFSMFGKINLEGSSGPAALNAVKTTDNFFDVLGVKPLLGRTWLPGEDQPGKDDVTVLSYEVWQNNFGGQQDVIGKTVQLDGQPYTLIGVMPQGFRFPMEARDGIYTPLHTNPSWAKARGMHWMPTVGRMKEGVTREQASADIAQALANLARQYPEQESGHTLGKLLPIDVAENSLDRFGNRTLKGPLGMLAMAVLALLGIACVNIAGLLLGRGVKREREMALRAAVGASRKRLLRQLVSESLVLCVAGTVGGILVSWTMLTAMRTFLIDAMSRGADIHLNWTVIAVAAAISVLTCVLSSLVPAVRLSGTDPSGSLRAASAGAGTARGQQRLRSSFVVMQVALSLVLLVASAMLLRNLQSLLETNLGVDPTRILSTRIDLSKGHYKGRDPVLTFYNPLIEKVTHLPGVKAAGVIDLLPVEVWGDGYAIHISGQPPYPPNQEMGAETRYVSAGYFDAMGIKLLRGRLLSTAIDKPENKAGTLVVNERFMKKFFPSGGDPVGAHLDDANKEDEKSEIVGVAADVRQSLKESQMAEMDWLIDEVTPKDRIDTLTGMTLVVRADGDLKSLVPELRNAIHEVDPTVPFRIPVTLSEVMNRSLRLERLESWLFGIFAGFALLLAVIGLYGLVNHEVESRTREIGIRMALGSTRRRVTQTVLSKVALLLTIGLTVGWALTFALRKILSSAVEMPAGHDLLTLVGLTGGLAAIGLLASLMPALRAASIEPVKALRID